MIKLDSERGKLVGFTSNRFEADSYLWAMPGKIIISFIASKRRGNFRELVRRIHALGLAVVVPTPLGRMQEIIAKNGYIASVEYDRDLDEFVELWTLKPPKPRAKLAVDK